MMTRIVRRSLLFTITHLVVVLMLIVYTFGDTMARFDNPEIAPTWISTTAAAVTKVLLLPLAPLWSASASRSLPDGFEWALFVVNSALWGAALGWLSTRRGHGAASVRSGPDGSIRPDLGADQAD